LPENETARAIVASLSGVDGGWKTIPLPAPTRTPQAVSTPQLSLAAAVEDLELVCGSLQWITNNGICTSLRAKLNAATRALNLGDRAAARSQVTAFLTELSSQHGPQRGKHVSDMAFSLLTVVGQAALDRI
jgi:hypothetical protein